MAKILVTGGAGYIGSHTAHRLSKHGYDVQIADNLSRGHRHNAERMPFHEIALGETDALTELMSREHFDAVVHFAAYIAVGESAREPELYFENNVAGSLSLFSAMNRAGVRRIVFSSTAAVYGDPEIVPIPEEARIGAVSPYGESKVMVERVLEWLDELRGLRGIRLRYFNACGAEPGSGLGEEHDPETHLIPLLLRAIKTGRPITIFGKDYPTPDGTCIRDYIHVSDLAEAHVLALESLLNGGCSDAFNVGTGRGFSVLEVMRAVEAVTGKQVPHVYGGRREGDSAVLVANSDKLQRTLNWRPLYTNLEDIVRTAWEFEQTRSQ
jgi:UDP-glucose-4-epimerase GalE